MGSIRLEARRSGGQRGFKARCLAVSTVLFIAFLFGVSLLNYTYTPLSGTMVKNVIPTALVSLLAMGGYVEAEFLYVSSYSGIVTTLNLTQSAAGRGLEVLSSTTGCGKSPSWLTVDAARQAVYCTDEGITDGTKGALSSFKTNGDGSLSTLSKVDVPYGPVCAVVYGQDRHGLAVAHYGGSAFSTWDITDESNLRNVQIETFTKDAEHDDSPHPHQAVLDPKGQFVVVPDLGADLVRVYSISNSSKKLTAHEPLVVANGSGPRHAAFVVKGTKTFMYLVTELSNELIGYQVVYTGGSLQFEQIWASGTHGEGKAVPAGAAAAEVVVSPDRKFLIISSRGENSLTIPSFDPASTATIVSDPILTFSIDEATGGLTLVQETACGGKFPRQFSVNKAGTLVAVGMQHDARVVVIERDVATGLLGKFVAHADIAGEVTAVVFNE
ncbi:hypothetical protein G7046_g3535 [Stylonectria norvegica]|nr:hypothetical protein G7046_g3535 [Stylonectria norvegica]